MYECHTPEIIADLHALAQGMLNGTEDQTTTPGIVVQGIWVAAVSTGRQDGEWALLITDALGHDHAFVSSFKDVLDRFEELQQYTNRWMETLSLGGLDGT